MLCGWFALQESIPNLDFPERDSLDRLLSCKNRASITFSERGLEPREEHYLIFSILLVVEVKKMLSETSEEESENQEESPTAEMPAEEAPAAAAASEEVSKKTAEGTQTETTSSPESKEKEDKSAKFVSTGEGTVSDGKGSHKKVFFLKNKDGQERLWLKKLNEKLVNAKDAAGAAAKEVGASANDAVARLTKKNEEKEAEDKEHEDDAAKKERFKAIVDAGRASVESASSRISGFVASMKHPEEAPPADGESTETPP